MENLIKKLTYAGLGFVALSSKKAQELATDIAEKTNLSEEEGKKLVEDLQAESEKMRGDLDETIQSVVNKTIKRLNIPDQEDYEQLKNRVSELEAKLKEQGQDRNASS